MCQVKQHSSCFRSVALTDMRIELKYVNRHSIDAIFLVMINEEQWINKWQQLLSAI
jgi:hypothetical protein